MSLLAVVALLPDHTLSVLTNLGTVPINEASDLDKSSGEEMMDVVRFQKDSELEEIVKKTL